MTFFSVTAWGNPEPAAVYCARTGYWWMAYLTLPHGKVRSRYGIVLPASHTSTTRYEVGTECLPLRQGTED